MVETHLEPDGAGGLNRRQVLKAAAWAAPVIVLATAAPAAAASLPGGPGDPQGPPLRFDNFDSFFTDDGAGHRNGVILDGEVSVTYDNSGPGFTGYPVGNVTMTVALPTAWFSAASVVTYYENSGARWTQIGTGVVQGAVVRFSFLSVANLTTTGPLNTGNLTLGFSSTVILPPGTVFDVGGYVVAPHGQPLAGTRTLTVP